MNEPIEPPNTPPVAALPYFEGRADFAFLIRPIALAGMIIGVLRLVSVGANVLLTYTTSSYRYYPFGEPGWRGRLSFAVEVGAWIAALTVIIAAGGCLRMRSRARRPFVIGMLAVGASAIVQSGIWWVSEMVDSNAGTFLTGWSAWQRSSYVLIQFVWAGVSLTPSLLIAWLMSRPQVCEAFRSA